ncbi:MAG: nucleotide sugar dehydrogenase [Burkholderiales bacterium]|nr:nucleotide sugar dehydrogenase [Burkholderiales bacterium]
MTDLLGTLKGRIDQRDAKVAVIGLGYVGLPLVLRFAEVGFPVIGVDIDADKVTKLEAGESYIEHIPAAAVRSLVAKGFRATTDFSVLSSVDAIVICVPTPLNLHREPDLSYVTGTMDAVAPHMRAGQLVALESTTYPGTTEEELRPRIERQGLVVGQTAFLCFSPEREDPANTKFKTQTIPKVCGGSTPACLEAGVALYSKIIDKVVEVSSTRAAEMTKLLENIHRAVNIGLVNEMKVVADRMGIDIHEVIRAAATKPFGFVPYWPGPGLGGHCIPIDPFYLTWKAREYGVNTRFIELAGEINSAMPNWVVSKLADALNDRERSLKGSRILMLGVAYKKNVDDMRESPALELMEILGEKGAQVDYSDPHVPALPKTRRHHFELASVALDAETVAGYDAVLLATDHDAFDYDLIRKCARLIVDTRGVYASGGANIVKA